MSSLGKVGSANAKSSQDMTGAVACIGVVVPLPAGMIHSNGPSISGLGETLDTPPPTPRTNWDLDIYKMKAPLSCKTYLRYKFVTTLAGVTSFETDSGHHPDWRESSPWPDLTSAPGPR